MHTAGRRAPALVLALRLYGSGVRCSSRSSSKAGTVRRTGAVRRVEAGEVAPDAAPGIERANRQGWLAVSPPSQRWQPPAVGQPGRDHANAGWRELDREHVGDECGQVACRSAP